MNNKIGKFSEFEELPVFKDSHSITLEVYKLSYKLPKHELYALTSQIRRATASIGANITEGLYRHTKKELIQYLYQARGSTGELIYHLLLAADLGYITHAEYIQLRIKIESVIKQLSGWIKSEKKKLM